ncbi:MAG TPA: COX15/CtaA family protein, partial [Acidimicrobiales bacterium]|nr:COX15/CtaA family protein [Acidimicrobiales bacterium]
MSVLRSLTSSLNSPFASLRSAGRRAWALSATPVFYRRSAALAVAALAVGIVSGGAVRLTGSGLGCRDWPGCTVTSIVAPLQYHAWIEFGNRLVNVFITIGVVLVAIAAVRRRPRRRDLVALSGGLVAGIFAEVVLGGETVLHSLAPPFVMAHFLLAMVLLVNAVVLHHRARQPEDVVGAPIGGATLLPARRLVRPSHVVA